MYDFKTKAFLMVAYLFLFMTSWSSTLVLLCLMTIGKMDLNRPWNYVMVVFLLFFSLSGLGMLKTIDKENANK